MNTVITIGRQFGSGGHEIGEKVAEYFGIQCLIRSSLPERPRKAASVKR